MNRSAYPAFNVEYKITEVRRYEGREYCFGPRISWGGEPPMPCVSANASGPSASPAKAGLKECGFGEKYTRSRLLTGSKARFFITASG